MLMTTLDLLCLTILVYTTSRTQVTLYEVLLHDERDLLYSRCLSCIQREGPKLLCRSKVIVFRYFGTKACFINTKLKVYKTYMMKHVWNESTTKVLKDRCYSKGWMQVHSCATIPSFPFTLANMRLVDILMKTIISMLLEVILYSKVYKALNYNSLGMSILS